MNDSLIETLASDLKAVRAPSYLPLMIIAGLLFALCSAFILSVYGPRADWQALNIMAVLKWLLFFTAALASLRMLYLSALPGRKAGLVLPASLAGLAALLMGAVIASVSSEGAAAAQALSLPNALVCFATIVGMGTCLLLAALAFLHSAAPTRLAASGAMAGATAGALAASAYALHCPIDHPLYVMAWYGGAVLCVSALGAFIAAFRLRW